MKRQVARLTGEAGSRIAFVVTSGLTLTFIVLHWQPLRGEVWRLVGPAAWGMTALYVTAIAGTVLSARYIDVAEFVGVRQLLRAWRGVPECPPELSVRGPYAYCRHPMYVLIIIAFWAAPIMTWSRLEFAVLGTLYFVVGVLLEERNLRKELGPAYDEYCANVPMWIPRRTSWHPR